MDATTLAWVKTPTDESVETNVSKKEQPSVAIMVAIAVVALALIGFWGYRTLAGPSYTKVPTAKEVHSRAEQLAIKSGGDFNALSPDEQKRLDEMTLGHGRKYVEINYKRLTTGGK